MKKLLIVRHAKSSWDNPEIDDFQRPLNERGNRDAPGMGKKLKVKNIHPDLFLSSPAVRTHTTATIIATAIGYPTHDIKTESKLYHASEEQILEILRKVDDHHNIVAIVGHNPGLTEFTNRLLNEAILNIPTCGIVLADLPIRHWSDISFGCGKQAFFDFPKNKS
jgi:phosphohistidine phosphatase